MCRELTKLHSQQFKTFLGQLGIVKLWIVVVASRCQSVAQRVGHADRVFSRPPAPRGVAWGGDAKGASRLDLGSDAVVRHYTGTVGVETGLCNIHYKQNLVWSVD